MYVFTKEDGMLTRLETEAKRQPQITRILDSLREAPFEGGAWCGGYPNPASGWIDEPEPPHARGDNPDG